MRANLLQLRILMHVPVEYRLSVARLLMDLIDADLPVLRVASKDIAKLAIM